MFNNPSNTRFRRSLPALILFLVLVTSSLACRLTDFAARQNENAGPGAPASGGNAGPLATPDEGRIAVDPDLVQATLTTADLPNGFNPLSESEQQQFGISRQSLANNFAGMLSQAQPQNYTAFLKFDANGFQTVMASVLAPLTTVERIAVDVYFSDPDQVAADFGESAGAQTSATLAGADGFGDKSIGLTFVTANNGVNLRSDAVLIRRDQTLSVVLVTYLDGSQPEVSAQTLAGILDERVSAALQ